jgi:hypothetical protein
MTKPKIVQITVYVLTFIVAISTIVIGSLLSVSNTNTFNTDFGNRLTGNGLGMIVVVLAMLTTLDLERYSCHPNFRSYLFLAFVVFGLMLMMGGFVGIHKNYDSSSSHINYLNGLVGIGIGFIVGSIPTFTVMTCYQENNIPRINI